MNAPKIIARNVATAYYCCTHCGLYWGRLRDREVAETMHNGTCDVCGRRNVTLAPTRYWNYLMKGPGDTNRPPNTPGPWVTDVNSVDSPANMAACLEDSKCEWIAVGIEDKDGYAESVAYCHPCNAAAISKVPDLIDIAKVISGYTGGTSEVDQAFIDNCTEILYSIEQQGKFLLGTETEKS